MTEGTARAWGWVAHVRDGGTTPWDQWSGAGEPAAEMVPGAQQLELLRRVNRVGRPCGALVERVLRTDPPRRSRPGLPLAGGPPVADHGPRPVDPGDLREGELSRLAAMLLAQDLVTARPPSPPSSWPRPWRVRHRLLGDPEYVGTLRRHLDGRGRPEGGVGTLVVIGTDTGRMLLDVWTAQCLRHGSGPWGTWLGRRVDRGRLPQAIDLPRLVRDRADLPSTLRVHLVTEPALAARLAGVRRAPRPPSPLAASAVDLGRRVCGALRPLAPPERRRPLVTEVLRPALADVPGVPLVVPAAYREWVRQEAERLHRYLLHARYPVHGDPGLVLPVDRAGVEEPDMTETLALAIRMLLSGELRRATKEEP